METDGGGWLVIQRRLPNGTVNFTRDWSDYENGFGDLNGEFWYGLRNIHALTSRDEVELRIDMVMEDDDSELSWTYQTFSVAGASDKYRLTIGGGVGTHGSDAMESIMVKYFLLMTMTMMHQEGKIVLLSIKEDGGITAVIMLILMDLTHFLPLLGLMPHMQG